MNAEALKGRRLWAMSGSEIQLANKEYSRKVAAAASVWQKRLGLLFINRLDEKVIIFRSVLWKN